MPTIDDQLLAQQFGFAHAVLQSDPELANLFKQAVAETWTPDRFTASVRSTKWFQTHAESWRNAQILKAADPASYANQVGQIKSYMGMIAGEMGLNIAGVVNTYAETAFQYGWDQNQIRQNLSKFAKTTDGQLWGQIGQVANELRQRAFDQGITLADSVIQKYATQVAGGYATADDYITKINEMAASAFPHLSDRIRAGETVADIASPYRQTMAGLLEMNPDGVGLNDPMIKQALSSKDKEGKPVLKTLWEFEGQVRQDARWRKTKNAQDAAMQTTRKVLADWGLVG